MTVAPWALAQPTHPSRVRALRPQLRCGGRRQPRALAGGDEREVAGAVAAAVRMVALPSVEQVEPVQPWTRRADRVSSESANRALVRDSVVRRVRRDDPIECVSQCISISGKSSRSSRRTCASSRSASCTTVSLLTSPAATSARNANARPRSSWCSSSTRPRRGLLPEWRTRSGKSYSSSTRKWLAASVKKVATYRFAAAARASGTSEPEASRRRRACTSSAW